MVTMTCQAASNSSSLILPERKASVRLVSASEVSDITDILGDPFGRACIIIMTNVT